MFTFYSVPYEAISRLQLIPMSLSTTLFPAMSEREGINKADQSGVGALYVRTMNLIVLLILPVSVTISVFSPEILKLWLGGEFPVLSRTVFSILAIAVFIQAVGYIPVTALQAIGKPDVATKYYLLEIPLYILLCFVLIPTYGIEGAAWAWLVRLAIIVPAIHVATSQQMNSGHDTLSLIPIGRAILLNAMLAASMLIAKGISLGVVSLSVVVLLSMLVYGIVSWLYCLDDKDRFIFAKLVGYGSKT
jgi:O-antigen/teichoic acid export membrane protein